MSNKNIVEPAYNASGWSTPLNANFVNTDAAFGGVQAFNLAAASGTVAVSATVYAGAYPANTASYVPLIWSLSGTLTAAVNLQIPSGVGGRWLCNNVTSGAFTVTISSAGAGATITASQGVITDFYSDGTNIYAIGTNAVPTGTLIAFAGSSAPTGFLLSYGQSLSTTTYSNLYGVIGYTYGGSGASFNAPDLRGYVLAGPDNMGGTAAGRLPGYFLGTAAGLATATLSVANLASHTHGDYGHAHGLNDPTHRHSYGAVGGGYAGVGGLGTGTSTQLTGAAATGISIATGYANLAAAGSGTAFGIVQPTFALNYAIKY